MRQAVSQQRQHQEDRHEHPAQHQPLVFTPRILVQSLVQYNNQAQAWTANARFGWLNTAGTGLFVVFNEGQVADGFFDWVRPQSRSLIVKYTKQFGTGG